MYVTARVNKAIFVYCNNTVALVYNKDSKYHNQTKYVDIRYRYI